MVLATQTKEICTHNAPAGCENIYASSNNNVNYDCEMLNLFKPQSELATQLGHQSKDMVEGGATIYYYPNGALDCECNSRQPIRDDVFSNFYPEA